MQAHGLIISDMGRLHMCACVELHFVSWLKWYVTVPMHMLFYRCTQIHVIDTALEGHCNILPDTSLPDPRGSHGVYDPRWGPRPLGVFNDGITPV